MEVKLGWINEVPVDVPREEEVDEADTTEDVDVPREEEVEEVDTAEDVEYLEDELESATLTV